VRDLALRLEGSCLFWVKKVATNYDEQARSTADLNVLFAKKAKDPAAISAAIKERWARLIRLGESQEAANAKSYDRVDLECQVQ
jgi:hypothetical protein